MKVFLSWSGQRSFLVATALKEWLPLVLQDTQPWLSTEDIRKGSRWQAAIVDALTGSEVGIFCLTRENVVAPWLLFEAGAITNATQAVGGLACTYLLDVENSDVPLPLGMFQSTAATREDTLRLVVSLNARLPAPLPDERVAKLVEKLWPELESMLGDAQSRAVASPPVRAERELLNEVLEIVRSIARQARTGASAERGATDVDVSEVLVAFSAASKLATPEVMQALEEARRTVTVQNASQRAIQTALANVGASIHTPIELQMAISTMRSAVESLRAPSRSSRDD